MFRFCTVLFVAFAATKVLCLFDLDNEDSKFTLKRKIRTAKESADLNITATALEANLTCTDKCLEELTNFTNQRSLHSNTTFDYQKDGKIVYKIDPKDFIETCAYMSKTWPCLKKCHDDDTVKVITSFESLNYLCTDAFKDVKDNYACMYGAIVNNPEIDSCSFECVENTTKASKQKTSEESCLGLLCVSRCSTYEISRRCKKGLVPIARHFMKIQVDAYEKFREAKSTWPADCVHLQNTLISDKPL